MKAPRPVNGVVRTVTQTRDGKWSAVVRVAGSNIRVMIKTAAPLREGAQVRVVGSGSDWGLAA